jgi:hypothetical protein
MNDRPCLFTVFLLVLVIIPLISLHEARADYEFINFSEYPLETVITNQYRQLGIVFSGEPNNPIIRNPKQLWPELPDDPALLCPKENRSTLTFVDPINESPVEAVDFAASVYVLQSGSITFTFKDLYDNVIREQICSYGSNYCVLDSPTHFHKLDIVPTGYRTLCFLDNLYFYLPPLIITKPEKYDVYQLSQNDYTESEDITFKAEGRSNLGTVNWNVELYYATSGNVVPLQPPPDSFTSHINHETTRTYQSKGGRMTVNASAGYEEACPVENVYILGPTTGIPNSIITTRLLALYQTGATPNLLCGIATKESSYTQFSNIYNLDLPGKWPKESPPARFPSGSFIGLMQVGPLWELSTEVAWNWLKNTEKGAEIFEDKKRAAKRLELSICQAFPSLPPLTAKENEDMALVLYGPYGDAALDKQYYIPQECCAGYCWVENYAYNQNGVLYAKEVRYLADHHP